MTFVLYKACRVLIQKLEVSSQPVVLASLDLSNLTQLFVILNPPQLQEHGAVIRRPRAPEIQAFEQD